MADYGNLGTSPYNKVVLDNTAQTGTDTPCQISFVGDPTTGIFRIGAGQFGLQASGVAIASVSPTTFTVSKYFARSASGSLSAAGTSVAGALSLTNEFNFVDNAQSSTGCILPSYSAVGTGGSISIFNAGVNAIQIYGDGASTIDGVAAATGVTLSAAKRAQFIVKSAAKWVSAQFGAVSA